MTNWPWIVLLALLLAGCSGGEAPDEGSNPASTQSMSQTGTESPAVPLQVVELLNQTFTLQPNSIPAAASFDVPARSANLTLRIISTSTSTCRAASPEVHSNATITSPMVQFQSPTGNRTEVPYDSPTGCNLQGSPGPLEDKSVPVAVEAGTWSVQVRGWGMNFEVGVIVTVAAPTR